MALYYLFAPRPTFLAVSPPEPDPRLPKYNYYGSDLPRPDPDTYTAIATYFEEDDSGWIQRTISVFPDGRIGITRERDSLEVGAWLPEKPDPPRGADVNKVPEGTVEISRKRFERYWSVAVERLQREQGIVIPV